MTDPLLDPLEALHFTWGELHWTHDIEAPVESWHVGDPCERCGEPMRDPAAVDETAVVTDIDQERGVITVDKKVGHDQEVHQRVHDH